MRHRKRTDEEQRMFDEIEALREKRRALVAARDAARAEFEALTHKHDNAAILRRGHGYLRARDMVNDIDALIAGKKVAYDATRAAGDLEVGDGK